MIAPSRPWISPEARAEIRHIWLAGNDFTQRDIAGAAGVTEAQVRHAVRGLPKSEIQQRRHNNANTAQKSRSAAALEAADGGEP